MKREKKIDTNKDKKINGMERNRPISNLISYHYDIMTKRKKKKKEKKREKKRVVFIHELVLKALYKFMDKKKIPSPNILWKSTWLLLTYLRSCLHQEND